MEMISISIVVVVVWACKSVKTHRNVHLNWVHCIAYKLYCNIIDLKTKKAMGQNGRKLLLLKADSSGIIFSMARLAPLHLDKADGNTVRKLLETK